MRSIWKGSISFGLVNIPVAVYPATREQKISFKQLRKSDLSPIRHQKVAEADVEDAPARTQVSAPLTIASAAADPAEEIVKGYEYEKGKYVVLTESDFEKVKIESTHTIEITDFVEQAQINLKYFYKPYFLEAQKGGEKGYSLLHRALTVTGMLGIAKVSIRSKEYLAAVKPDGLFLMLELMHFAQEVLEPEGLRPAAEEVPARELEMAKQLISAMAADWDPQKYENSYHTALKALVDEKIQNRPAAGKALPAKSQMVGDILSILQASFEKNAERKKKRQRKAHAADRPIGSGRILAEDEPALARFARAGQSCPNDAAGEPRHGEPFRKSAVVERGDEISVQARGVVFRCGHRDSSC